MINDYVLTNSFSLFATFTFDPRKTDRYNIDEVYRKMQRWLWQQTSKYQEFSYIVVPEQHKDGAYHFHALMNGYEGELKSSKVMQHGKRVYNLPDWRFGFTNITKLDDDKMKTIAYMCKYITKDMVMIRGNRRYWASRGLNKPELKHNAIYDLGIASRLEARTLKFETIYNVVYEVPRD